jgi:hypothetical protein
MSHHGSSSPQPGQRNGQRCRTQGSSGNAQGQSIDLYAERKGTLGLDLFPFGREYANRKLIDVLPSCLLDQKKDIPFAHPSSGDPAKCPHAKAAAQAAAVAASEASALKLARRAAPQVALSNAAQGATFKYSSFYESELEKKHKDKSYRYFNNINRLAAKFPVAHTRDTKDEVDVWCSNDYLGMSKNGVVLDTMK